MRREWSRARGLVIGDGRRYARMRQRPADLGGGPVPPPFGQACTAVVNDSLSTTTSTGAYVNHLTLVTPVLVAGDYFLGGTAYYSQSETVEGDCQIQVLLDAVEIFTNRGHSNGSGVGAQDAKNHFGGALVGTLAAGAHVIELNFRVGAPSGAGDEVAMYWSELELWSFN